MSDWFGGEGKGEGGRGKGEGEDKEEDWGVPSGPSLAIRLKSDSYN